MWRGKREMKGEKRGDGGKERWKGEKRGEGGKVG